jgi:hypothetical protein
MLRNIRRKWRLSNGIASNLGIFKHESNVKKSSDRPKELW